MYHHAEVRYLYEYAPAWAKQATINAFWNARIEGYTPEQAIQQALQVAREYPRSDDRPAPDLEYFLNDAEKRTPALRILYNMVDHLKEEGVTLNTECRYILFSDLMLFLFWIHERG